MLQLERGTAVLADGSERTVSLRLEGGAIAGIDPAPSAGGPRFDASGLLVLPGIVDLHGDAFERQLQPRPGVNFPTAMALRDTEAQLLANGITTAFHAVTLSWEPGLRGAGRWREIVDAISAARPTASCDVRVHMRWELHNLAALPMALEDVAQGRVGMIGFNDHTPAILRKSADPAEATAYSKRAGLDVPAFRALAEASVAAPDAVEQAMQRLAEAARAAGVPMASHDDDSVSVREAFRARGARICEFPMHEPVAEAARAAGDAVVMGCPNVVRGGSHLGWASAAALAERGLCTVLCSDYYYPAMMPAAWALSRRMGLARAWALISKNPAEAAGLDDRGLIAEGKRADLVVVDPNGPEVVATVGAGVIRHLSGAGWRRWNG